MQRQAMREEKGTRNMRAIILAGGRGTRLHPLTTRIPKPLVPMFDKPVMQHTVELLARHGICDITVTVSYRANQIMEWFGDGSALGVNIDYYIEETPRGTAGGLKDMADTLPDTFVVLSGDALTDFDINEAIRFHHNKRAKATLLTYEVADPSQFGIVQTDNAGRIVRFLEKPSPDQVFTRTANTGIYVLDPSVIDFIPSDSVFDFSRDLFPMLMQETDAMWARAMKGYWCDVGNLAQYRDAHFDAMTGRVKVSLPGTRLKAPVWVGEGCEIHPSARFCAPVYLGDGVKVGAGAFVGGYAVVGEGSVIGDGARVAHSVIGRQSEVLAEATVLGSVLGDSVSLQEAAHVSNHTLVADGQTREIRPATDVRLVEDVTAEVRRAWAPASRTALASQAA